MDEALTYIGYDSAIYTQILPCISSFSARIENVLSGINILKQQSEFFNKMFEPLSAITKLRKDPIYTLMMQELMDGKLGDVDEMFMSDLIPRYWNLHGLSTVIQGEGNATPSAFLTGFHISLYDIDKKLLIVDDIPNALQKLISYRNRKFSKKGNEKHLAPRKRALEIANEKLINNRLWNRQDIVDYIWQALGKEVYKNGDETYSKEVIWRWIKSICPADWSKPGRKKKNQ